MQRIAGAFGNSNGDEYLRTTKCTHRNGSLKIDLFDGSSHSLQVPAKPSKITLPSIPDEFRRNVSKSRAGGGAVNSRIAAESVGVRGSLIRRGKRRSSASSTASMNHLGSPISNVANSVLDIGMTTLDVQSPRR